MVSVLYIRLPRVTLFQYTFSGLYNKIPLASIAFLRAAFLHYITPPKSVLIQSIKRPSLLSSNCHLFFDDNKNDYFCYDAKSDGGISERLFGGKSFEGCSKERVNWFGSPTGNNRLTKDFSTMFRNK